MRNNENRETEREIGIRKIKEEIARCEKALDNPTKSRWLYGYVDGMKKALAWIGE